jgi:non-heme chloroperoxidase
MLADDEAEDLCDRYPVPGPGKVLVQAANANFNPWTEDKVDTRNPERGALTIIAGEKHRTVPQAVAHASLTKERRDHGWRDVWGRALEFVKRFL